MNTIEEMFNAGISDIIETEAKILSHPSDYPGNTKNERLLRIPEKEVMAFTDDMGAADEYEEEALNPLAFVKPDIEIDSVSAHLSFARQLDSLLRVK